MGQLKISQNAFNEVAAALEEYRALCNEKVAKGEAKRSAADTYVDRATYFVRWLEGDFNPFSR
jgi:hypothetical protein